LENNELHKRLWFNDKRNDHRRICPCAEDLARMLITGENEGEYTEEQKEYAGRRNRRQKAEAYKR